jgi:hypothetical protein
MLLQELCMCGFGKFYLYITSLLSQGTADSTEVPLVITPDFSGAESN